MAFSYKTPGAYIEEIVKLPPSVAQVETAIPVFFGVTAFATELEDQDLVGKSYKISSFADYQFYYGGPDAAQVAVMVKLNQPPAASLANEYHKVMYYAVKHYFDNGGGPCYIHSLGKYDEAGISDESYQEAIGKLDLDDEVTLVVIPDIGGIESNKAYAIYNKALTKATGLQDKFVIIDVRMEKSGDRFSASKSKDGFRSAISSTAESIKYGAAYFPHLKTTYSYDYASARITLAFDQRMKDENPDTGLLEGLEYAMVKGIFALDQVNRFLGDDSAFKNIPVESYPGLVAEINRKAEGIRYYFSEEGYKELIKQAEDVTEQLTNLGQAAVPDTEGIIVFDYEDTTEDEKKKLAELIRAKALELGEVVKDSLSGQSPGGTWDYAFLQENFINKIVPFFNSVFEAKMKEAFLSIPVILPPSPAVAGLYAFVDRTRGVWKAPANVTVNATIEPVVRLSDLAQDDFNVDAENGKSINCIRNFTGRGNIVWGARTLAGNDNEWRYVNVRRLFNMVEESCRNASRQFVFEPNDANTWVRVKGMIDNYLINLWRAGALQGSKPEHAFYCQVGLGSTMIRDDIVNGVMKVEIGLAAVRPAEFIILQFSHKLAES